MAGIVINNPADPRVIYSTQYTSVWVKPYWGADWRYVPYLFPENSLESAAPSDSTASYTWEYGRYLNLWNRAGGYLLPINLENWIIKTVVHTRYGNYISWIGVVVGETLVEDGIYLNSGYPRGKQTIECRGLEYLLERRNVLGTYVGNSTEWAYLPVTRDFNVSNTAEELTGNRSAQINQFSQTYLFGDEQNKWSNLQVANYLISAFQPWYPYESYRGQVDYVPLFYVVGQTAALDRIFEEHRFHGTTVREALNKLIDRRRGFGWRIATDGVGPIYIVVFSLAQHPIMGTRSFVPANPRQLDVPIHDDKFIQARLRISSMNAVDEIIVQSDTPVRTVATLGFATGSLEPAWDSRLDEDLPEEALTVTVERPGQSDLTVNIEDLATQLIDEFDAMNVTVPFKPVVSFTEFEAYTNLPLGVFNVLDANHDGWLTIPDLQTFLPGDTYQSVTEDERASDKYAPVYSHFQVPKTWGWNGWVPDIDDNGRVYPELRGAYASWNHSFLRFLPFKEHGTSIDSEREYLEPFALVAHPSRYRDIVLALANAGGAPYDLAAAQAVVTDLAESEFDQIANEFDQIGWTEIQTVFAAEPYRYVHLDRTEQLEYPAASMRMGDAGMKVIIKSQANHVFARNHWDGAGSEIQPIFDYETLLPTVAFETDVVPRVRLPIWTQTYIDPLDPEGSLRGISSPTGKQVYIEVPDKQVWMAAPWCVREVSDGELVYVNSDDPSTPKILRDDTGDLRFIALIAYVWYGQQRASAEFEINNQLAFFTVGDLVRSTISGYWWERIGTCVTGIARDYQNNRHVVTTGYGELDPGGFEGAMAPPVTAPKFQSVAGFWTTGDQGGKQE